MPEQPAKGESKITSISKNKFLTLIIGVTVILVLIGAGWYYFSQSSTERDAEKKLEAETGGKVNIEGDKVTIEGEVIAKSQSTRMITIKTTAYNQLGKCIVDGIAKVMVLESTSK